jgi:SAM-dependent methyltransferase
MEYIPMLSKKNKYKLVGERVLHGSEKCLLIDLGSRDRILEKYLPSEVQYIASDIIPGQDVVVNLEFPLPFADHSIDVVVCLDVLEHLENIHLAYAELLRVTRKKLFISLPNLTCLSKRIEFLITGNLGGKYDLLPSHQGDRHRWLTSYDQLCSFITYPAINCGASITQWDIVSGFNRLHWLLSFLPISSALKTFTVLFELEHNLHQ